MTAEIETISNNIFNYYYNTGQNSEFVVNGFLKICTLSSNLSSTLDTLIYEASSTSTNLYFSPNGSLFTQGKSGGTNSLLFQNPITSAEEFQNYWTPIDINKYSKYTTITFPQCITSQPSIYKNGSIGSGFFIARENVYPASSIYYLLINPMNRSNAKGLGLNQRLPEYCAVIQNQDDACYCLPATKSCYYATMGGQANYEALINSKDPKSISALQTLKSQCQCNKICQSWTGYQNINPLPQCGGSYTNILCGVNISSSSGAKIDTGALGIAQNCGNTDNTDNTSPPVIQSQSSTPIYISVAVATLIIVITVILVKVV